MTAKTDFNLLSCGFAGEKPQNRLKDRKYSFGNFVQKRSPQMSPTPGDGEGGSVHILLDIPLKFSKHPNSYIQCF
jgi:hypothetical protein